MTTPDTLWQEPTPRHPDTVSPGPGDIDDALAMPVETFRQITPEYAATLPTLVLMQLPGQLDETQRATVRKELEGRLK